MKNISKIEEKKLNEVKYDTRFVIPISPLCQSPHVQAI